MRHYFGGGFVPSRLTSIRIEEAMKSPSLLTGLTLVNLGMLVFVLIRQVLPVQADSPDQVLRARALEIVDAQGKIRASISVIPEGPARADGSPLSTAKGSSLKRSCFGSFAPTGGLRSRLPLPSKARGLISAVASIQLT